MPVFFDSITFKSPIPLEPWDLLFAGPDVCFDVLVLKFRSTARRSPIPIGLVEAVAPPDLVSCTLETPGDLGGTFLFWDKAAFAVGGGEDVLDGVGGCFGFEYKLFFRSTTLKSPIPILTAPFTFLNGFYV
ncbi:hypothetical protein P378_20115 [Desulforamulus profundi]|uniref:Uncharacterized protein n=1 Tax=Desulforamulus profundi TaxID=1383067 RepID=A0A2C6MBE7_9FIRM|nr:hypothetical protein [Desulforamulus profundi]PHJ36815.1 hypothetical protein P378_20115 [Desulforamulus profundi]